MTIATREDYFRCTMDLLGSEGFGSVRIANLCGRLGVTVGSFYHHFDNVEGFVDALMDHWQQQQQQTQRIAELASVPADPRQRVRRMKQLVGGLPHGAEAAIRAWSTVDAQVARAQRRVDERRRAALQTLLEGVVPDRREARHLSIVGMTLLVGWQQWRSPADTRELRRLLDEFERLVLRTASATGGDVE